MNIEIDPMRIIKETRLEKHVFVLSHAEVAFIVKHKTITAEEKLLWFLLASLSANDENLTCSLSFDEIAQKVGFSSEHLSLLISNLEIMGFLKCQLTSIGERYHISLPNSGLLHLRLASKKNTPKWLETLRHRVGKEIFMWW